MAPDEAGPVRPGKTNSDKQRLIFSNPAVRTNGAMSLLVKICGLKTPEALDVALDAGADMVGFVFFPPSPRHLGVEAARALGARVQGRAQKVALSVDADDAQLAASSRRSSPTCCSCTARRRRSASPRCAAVSACR